MTSALNIAPGLALPVDVATQSIGVVAQRGAGKTYLAAVLIEELVGAGVPVCALDPVGVLWGLRLGADGKERDGLPIVILGGERGDVPLEPGAGKAVAEWIVAERRSSVLDLSGFRKGEQRQFVTDFAEELYRRNREPLHVVLDEADSFIPQRPMHGEERMLGAFEDLVRRGRARGIGLTMATQRPAVIHKDCLTQVSTLVALRMVGPQDVKAIDAWIQSHGSAEDRRRVLDSLPGLPIGEAWFWSPGWLGVLQRVKVRRRRTFDSSRAPAVGERRGAPANLSPVDLDALKGKLAQAVERAKADDPRELRKRIAELERAAKAASKTPAPEPKVERVEVSVLTKGDLVELERAATRLEQVADKATRTVKAIEEATAKLVEQAREPVRYANGLAGVLRSRLMQPVAGLPRPAAPTSRPPVRIPSTAETNGRSRSSGVPLSKAERAILTALAQYPDGRRKTQVAILTGYAHNGGGFNNAISALRSAGRLDGGSDLLRITDAGVDALGSYTPLPTGDGLREHWMRQLGKAERLALQALIDVYPQRITKEAVAEATGYEARGGGFSNAISRLRALDLIEGRGDLCASEELFG